MTLPLSKCLDPEHDYPALEEELHAVDAFFTAERPQHEHRRFEYGLALHAMDAWGISPQHRVVDVGGAGSPFWRMTPYVERVCVVDPDEPNGQTLAQYVRGGVPLADVVVALSVLEHVDDLDRFLYHLGCLVAPGGLLVLTYDCCEANAVFPADTYHFHWMRKRIFGVQAQMWLAAMFYPFGFEWFGAHDPSWQGAHVYDYSFASLVLRRKP